VAIEFGSQFGPDQIFAVSIVSSGAIASIINLQLQFTVQVGTV